MDIKNLAAILYANRTDKDYRTNQGNIRILAANGIKVAKRTFDGHAKEIKQEISKLHDLDSDLKSKATVKKELEKLFPQEQYIKGLSDIWQMKKQAGKIPTIKDKIQAGRQAAEFFGWNINDGENESMIRLKDGKITLRLFFGNKI